MVFQPSSRCVLVVPFPSGLEELGFVGSPHFHRGILPLHLSLRIAATSWSIISKATKMSRETQERSRLGSIEGRGRPFSEPCNLPFQTSAHRSVFLKVIQEIFKQISSANNYFVCFWLIMGQCYHMLKLMEKIHLFEFSRFYITYILHIHFFL